MNYKAIEKKIERTQELLFNQIMSDFIKAIDCEHNYNVAIEKLTTLYDSNTVIKKLLKIIRKS